MNIWTQDGSFRCQEGAVQKSISRDDGGTIALQLFYGQVFLYSGGHSGIAAPLKPTQSERGSWLEGAESRLPEGVDFLNKHVDLEPLCSLQDHSG